MNDVIIVNSSVILTNSKWYNLQRKINSQFKLSKMKNKLLNILTGVTLFLIPSINFGQVPTLGTAANFVLFTTSGAMGNNVSAVSHLTGNVGSNSELSTGFGNIDGVMDNANRASRQATTDLLAAYNQLNGIAADSFPTSLILGDGDTLTQAVYYYPAASTLDLNLTLNAKGDPNAVFIFQINGAFSTNPNSKVTLINGAKACNVFWKVEGAVNMATGTTMRGTVIANNALIMMNTGDTLEGRALSINGAVTVDGVLAYIPIGCGSPNQSPNLTGPLAPALASTECYAIFSSSGDVTNSGVTNVTGDVGTNVGLTTGFDSLKVMGAIHPIPDGSTALCAANLGNVYFDLNTLTSDIELLYPVQFGHNLVLTPHTYHMQGAAVLTDTVYLNAQNNANAVFVIQINGAFSTSTYSRVILINGAQAKNVFWKIDGAVSINDYSIFKGTIVCNNGAISLNTGVTLDGRAFTTIGQLTTAAIAATMPPGCSTNTTTGILSYNAGNTNGTATIYPNPFGSTTTIVLNDGVNIDKAQLIIYNDLGAEVMNTTVTKQEMILQTNKLPSGIYFYKIMSYNNIVQSGRLISQQ
jgi:hypothetical protein